MQYSNSSNASAEGKADDSADIDLGARGNVAWWFRWKKDAWENKFAARHRKEARRGWDEYEKNSTSDGDKRDDFERCNPAYFSACKTLEPAYYARTPKTVGRRRDGVDDPAALRAAKYAQRLGDHAVESCEFDECFSKIVQEFIHADKVTTQICHDFDAATGKHRIYPKPVMSDGMVHTVSATAWSEIQEIAYKFILSKEEAIARFPQIKGNVTWKVGKGSDEDAGESDPDDKTEYLEGWEAYCKTTKNVYWFSDQYPSGFLDVKPDEWGLRNFFPSPRAIIGSSPAKHLYPTPMYVQLSGTIRQLHKLYAKIFELINGIKRRALVDGSCPELLRAFEDLEDQEFITVENLGALIEKAGDASRLVWYLPVQELVNAIKELVELDSFFSQKFDLYFGVPDILRGVSDPLATATAESIAAGAAHDRFKCQKMQIQKLAADTIEMMVDLMLKKYDTATIARICRYEAMSQEDQQAFMGDLALLQDDEERLIRIDIKTDSMAFVNEALENQQRNAVVQTVVNGIKEIGALLAQGQPQYAAVALHSVVHALDGLRGGEDFIEEVKAKTQALIDQAMQPPPEAPPPPDYEQMKLELASQKMQLEAQSRDREIAIKEMDLQLKMQAQAADQQVKAMGARLDDAFLAIEQMRLQLDSRKVDIAEAEMVAEETRLANEADAEMVRAQGEVMGAVKEKEPATSITIVNAPQGGTLV